MNRPCFALSVLSLCLGCLPIAAEFAHSAPMLGARRSERIFYKVCCVPSNQCIHHENEDDTELTNEFAPAAEHDVPVANPITMDELNDDRYFYDDYHYDCYGYGDDDCYRYEDDPSDAQQNGALTIDEEDSHDFRSGHDPEYDVEVYGAEIEQLEDITINEDVAEEEVKSLEHDATSDFADDSGYEYDYEEYWHEYEVVESQAAEPTDEAIEEEVIEENVVETSGRDYDYEYAGDYGDDYEDYYGEEYGEYWGDSEPSPVDAQVVEDEPVVTEEVDENDWYDDEEYEAYDYEDYEPYGYEEYDYEVEEYDAEISDTEDSASEVNDVVEEQVSDDADYWYDWEDDADLSDVETYDSDALTVEEVEHGRSVLLLIANTLELASESLANASRKIASFANSSDLSASTQNGGDLR